MIEPVIRSIGIEITRWISDDFPGVVEFRFFDRTIKAVHFVDKAPIVTAIHLSADASFPKSGALPCVVLDERVDEAGLDYIEIDTSHPYGVESIDGRTRFLIAASQLLPQ